MSGGAHEARTLRELATEGGMAGSVGNRAPGGARRRGMAQLAALLLALATALYGCAPSTSVLHPKGRPTAGATATATGGGGRWREPVTPYDRHAPLTLDQVAQRYPSHMPLR